MLRSYPATYRRGILRRFVPTGAATCTLLNTTSVKHTALSPPGRERPQCTSRSGFCRELYVVGIDAIFYDNSRSTWNQRGNLLILTPMHFGLHSSV
jgi:hypothetical protein